MDRVTLTSHANESDPAVNADHKRLVFALCVIVGISFVVGASLNFMLTPMLDDLGLTEDWVVRVVKAVGNYGEIFERNIGTESPLKIQRGLNALWSKGGLQYAPPIR